MASSNYKEVDVIEESSGGKYNRYICPFCKRVLYTRKSSLYHEGLFDKVRSHKLVCKRYQAAVACGKASPNYLYYKIIHYQI